MFVLSSTDIHSDQLRKELRNPAAGALCVFEGWVRDRNDGRSVSSLEYEAFESLAQKEAARIIAEAKTKFDILEAICVHRTGRLKVGDLAVWVGVIAEHRDASFSACRYIIDEIKGRLPIWKKEHYLQGDSEWVNCAHSTSVHNGVHGGSQVVPVQLTAADLTGTGHQDVHGKSQPVPLQPMAADLTATEYQDVDGESQSVPMRRSP